MCDPWWSKIHRVVTKQHADSFSEWNSRGSKRGSQKICLFGVTVTALWEGSIPKDNKVQKLKNVKVQLPSLKSSCGTGLAEPRSTLAEEIVPSSSLTQLGEIVPA